MPQGPKRTREVVRHVTEEGTISLLGILRHTAVILVLLAGAASVGWVLINVKVPELVYLTLILLEGVVFLQVLNSLLQVMRASIRETKTTVLTLLDTVDEIREHRESKKLSLTIRRGDFTSVAEAEVNTHAVFRTAIEELVQTLDQEFKDNLEIIDSDLVKLGLEESQKEQPNE